MSMTTTTRGRGTRAAALPLILAAATVPLSSLAGPTTLTVGPASLTTGPNPAILEFPLTRSGDLGYAVVVEYRTVNGTAIGGTDFTPAAPGTFAVLETGVGSAVLPIAIAADAQGTFSLQLDGGYGTGPAMSLASTTTIGSGTTPVAVLVAEINNFGAPDVISVNQGNNNISVRVNTTTPGAITLGFGGSENFSVGSGPAAVAARDLDGDGRNDLVVANYSGSSVSVLRNQTSPGATNASFATSPALAVGLNPNFVRLADFNNDGLTDLVAAGDPTTHALAFRLNTTNLAAASGPAFGALQTVGSAFTITGLAVGDVDRDGRLDVVANGSGAVRVFRNLTTVGAATLSFAAPTSVTLAGIGSGLALGDIDGDGRLDIARGNGFGSIQIALNNGSGPGSIGFSAPTAIASGSDDFDLAIVDLNGDARPEIATMDFVGSEFAMFRNLSRPGGALRFGAAQTRAIAGNPLGLAIGDLNQDSATDVVLAQSGLATLALLRNTRNNDNPQITFATPVDIATNPDPASIATADLDLDGRLDLVLANRTFSAGPGGGQFVSLLRNNTAPGAGALSTEANYAESMQIGVVNSAWPFEAIGVDLNLDGRPDLASANYAQNIVASRSNAMTGPGSFVAGSFAGPFSAQTNNPGRPSRIISADLNGDGRNDLVSNLFFEPAAATNSFAFVLLNTTTPGGSPGFSGFTPADIGSPRPENAIVAVDVNSDGRPDLVASNFTDQNVRTFYNAIPVGSTSAATMIAAGTQAIAGRANGLAAGDFNRDGRMDVVSGTDIGPATVLLNTTLPGAATASWTRADVGTGINALGTSTADLNGDGAQDVLLIDLSNARATLLINRTVPGSPTVNFEQLPTIATSATPRAIAAVDLNADGKADLLVSSGTSPGRVSLYRSTAFEATASNSAAGTLGRVDPLFADSFE